MKHRTPHPRYSIIAIPRDTVLMSSFFACE
nr:MAG TPA: hypothetical protein [Bacteriophage sp.]